MRKLNPKAIFVGSKTLECAVAVAVCQFSTGSVFEQTLFQALDIDAGEHDLQEGALKDIRTVRSSNKKNSDRFQIEFR